MLIVLASLSLGVTTMGCCYTWKKRMWCFGTANAGASDKTDPLDNLHDNIHKCFSKKRRRKSWSYDVEDKSSSAARGP